MPRPTQKILVLGGGYAGVHVAWTLEKHTEVDLDITIVEPRGDMTYQALLPEVAGGHVDPRNATVDMTQAFRYAKVLRASPTRLNSAERYATADTIDGNARGLYYWHAAVASGAVNPVFP